LKTNAVYITDECSSGEVDTHQGMKILVLKLLWKSPLQHSPGCRCGWFI